MKLGTPGFHPARLREAREARELTATALADDTGVSRQSITYYEAGTSSPQPETLARLSAALSVPESYFLKDFAPVTAPAIHFRSLKKTPKKSRLSARVKTTWIARLARKLEDYLELPGVAVPALDGVDPRTLSFSDVDVVAAEVRQSWGLADGPISDLFLLLENNGAVVSSFPLSHDLISGFSLWEQSSDRPFITVNNRMAVSVKARFDAAHELGHMVMHRQVTERDQRDPGVYDLMESQAHRFASSFLMPSTSFLSDMAYPDLAVFEGLKRKWKTSIKSMIFKSKHAGLLDRESEKRLYIEYNTRYAGREPHDDLELESPRLLKRSIDLLLQENVVTLDGLSSEVSISTGELCQLASVDLSSLSEGQAGRRRGRNGLTPAPGRPSRGVHRDLG